MPYALKNIFQFVAVMESFIVMRVKQVPQELFLIQMEFVTNTPNLNYRSLFSCIIII